MSHPDFGKPPAQPGEPRAAPVWIAADERAREQAELRELRQFRAEQERAAERAAMERAAHEKDMQKYAEVYEAAMARKEREKDEIRSEKEASDKRWLDERRATVINDALAGRVFTGSDPALTAAKIRKLLAEEIEVVIGPEGSPVARDRVTGRPADVSLKERLDTAEWAIFFAATNKGGAGTEAARPAAATPEGPPTGDARNKLFAQEFLRKQAAAQQARF